MWLVSDFIEIHAQNYILEPSSSSFSKKKFPAFIQNSNNEQIFDDMFFLQETTGNNIFQNFKSIILLDWVYYEVQKQFGPKTASLLIFVEISTWIDLWVKLSNNYSSQVCHQNTTYVDGWDILKFIILKQTKNLGVERKRIFNIGGWYGWILNIALGHNTKMMEKNNFAEKCSWSMDKK